MVFTRGVLKGGGREEDTRLLHVYIREQKWLWRRVASTGLLGWTYPKIGVLLR
jgi:hypothetical protein